MFTLREYVFDKLRRKKKFTYEYVLFIDNFGFEWEGDILIIHGKWKRKILSDMIYYAPKTIVACCLADDICYFYINSAKYMKRLKTKNNRKYNKLLEKQKKYVEFTKKIYAEKNLDDAGAKSWWGFNDNYYNKREVKDDEVKRV